MSEPKARYPINAPTATASITNPLYVMNSNLQTCVSLEPIGLKNISLHDKKAVKDLHCIECSLDKHSLPLSIFFAVSPYSEQ